MDRDYWTKQLREPERAFEAATWRSDIDAAAKELQRAKAASPSALGSLLMMPWTALHPGSSVSCDG
jgi:hypothetical protein